MSEEFYCAMIRKLPTFDPRWSARVIRKWWDCFLELWRRAKRLDRKPTWENREGEINMDTITEEKPKYTVKFYKGDYKDRQNAANVEEAVCYLEHHFNASERPEPGYVCVVVGSNASRKSREWGRWYAAAIAEEFGTSIGGDEGLLVGGYRGRGNANIYYTRMPAILLEPLFASNPDQADIIRSEEGQERLARILVESIRKFFPDGGLVAFSVGHKYKTSRPRDRGAAIHGGGTEGDHAEKVLEKAAAMLEETNDH